MVTKITATELARNLSDILNRARYRRESFVVERNGDAIASIEPPPKKPFTLRDLVGLMQKRPWDDEFADDLERIHAEMNQPVPPPPEWTS